MRVAILGDDIDKGLLRHRPCWHRGAAVNVVCGKWPPRRHRLAHVSRLRLLNVFPQEKKTDH